MPLRSRAFSLSLRSRCLDFIPGGIYQGALNSFIHSFPHPSPASHTPTHNYMSATAMWFAVCLGRCLSRRAILGLSAVQLPSLKHILLLGFFTPTAVAWNGPSRSSQIYPMCVEFFPSQPLSHLVWHFQNNTSVFFFFYTGVHARMTCSTWRKRHCPFVRRVSFSVSVSVSAWGMQLYTHSRNVVNLWLMIDSYNDGFIFLSS